MYPGTHPAFLTDQELSQAAKKCRNLLERRPVAEGVNKADVRGQLAAFIDEQDTRVRVRDNVNVIEQAIRGIWHSPLDLSFFPVSRRGRDRVERPRGYGGEARPPSPRDERRGGGTPGGSSAVSPSPLIHALTAEER
jgi:hypothetical protein